MDFLWENIFKQSQKARTISALLAENFLFSDLTKKELRFVENIVHERHYRTGESIFKQGEIGVGMYIVVKGSVDIIVYDTDPTGKRPTQNILVTRLMSGDFFGEISLVEENGRRSASAVAAEDSIVIGFFKPDLMEILERSPATGVKVVFKLAEVLGRRLKETTDKITQLRSEIKLLAELQEKQNRDV
ncbi:MAG: cyclic nucleotide-binding domain-containing protein [Bdellovibrionales bacterium]|nr:cyclic nucleotide-binding domain-containing protein [Bdellovibrionales bacterium]